MYTSPRFYWIKKYAISNSKQWYILSAKYGLLKPNDIIEPYDVQLSTLTKKQLEKWVENTVNSINKKININDKVLFIGDDFYYDALKLKLKEKGYSFQSFMYGKSLDEKISFIKNCVENT
ncbi:MAG: hypothetical protein EAX90_06855 [Candidatus Heimdallarchaeota archaeon]|nr:hypothetical protein [Candidatus Heimdallarchaeota archaeon]